MNLSIIESFLFVVYRVSNDMSASAEEKRKQDG